MSLLELFCDKDISLCELDLSATHRKKEIRRKGEYEGPERKKKKEEEIQRDMSLSQKSSSRDIRSTSLTSSSKYSSAARVNVGRKERERGRVREGD